jgi:hypothetical protein
LKEIEAFYLSTRQPFAERLSKRTANARGKRDNHTRRVPCGIDEVYRSICYVRVQIDIAAVKS